MTDYYPGVILYNDRVQMVRGTGIGGMNSDAVFGMPTWKDIYVRH
jgi:hypothetical protein